MSFQAMRLAIAVVGIAIWVYGLRENSDRIRWVGIVVLGVAVLMRFFPRKPASPAQG